MALPSQVRHGGTVSRVSTSAGRDRGGRTVMVVSAAILLVAAGALTWIMLKGREGAPMPTAARPVTEAAGDRAAAPAAVELSLKPEPKSEPTPEPPIAVISQAVPRPGEQSAPIGLPKGGETTVPAHQGAVPRVDETKPPPTDLTRIGDPTVHGTESRAATPPPSPGAPLAASSSSAGVRAMIEEGDRKAGAGDPVAARALYSRALDDDRTTESDASALRARLGKLNDDLIFSGRYFPGEPFTEEYVVESGDNPTKIVRKRGLVTEPRLIEKTNRVDATRLRVGQKLKLIRGPFHAVVRKTDFRLDLYAGSPDDESGWVFIKSYPVGLGESNSTPVGEFVVRSSSKLINPPWTNPRTGERFLADDPMNPIGERWIGIEGVGESSRHTGFGIHGTIEPDSIGRMKSMGCVRMQSPDVEMIYDLLTEKVSVVRIEP